MPVTNPSMDWTEEYAFAESYAVWGWARNYGNCDSEIFRFVIDSPEEVS
jgi:hypothetical protein